jgi:hypothetical protein
MGKEWKGNEMIKRFSNHMSVKFNFQNILGFPAILIE